MEFAEAVIGEDDARLAGARERTRALLGDAGFVDAAGVVGLFDAIDRVADATGIPLEDEKAAVSKDIRADLGIDEWPALLGHMERGLMEPTNPPAS